LTSKLALGATKVDFLREPNVPEKRRLSDRSKASQEDDRQQQPPPPQPQAQPATQIAPAPPRRPQRPGHLSSKSASAIPTLSTFIASPTTGTAPGNLSPTIKSQRPLSKSWLSRPRPRPGSMAAQEGSLNPPNTAVDLLRQAMMHK